MAIPTIARARHTPSAEEGRGLLYTGADNADCE